MCGYCTCKTTLTTAVQCFPYINDEGPNKHFYFISSLSKYTETVVGSIKIKWKIPRFNILLQVSGISMIENGQLS